jgi:hypothetical protein
MLSKDLPLLTIYDLKRLVGLAEMLLENPGAFYRDEDEFEALLAKLRAHLDRVPSASDEALLQLVAQPLKFNRGDRVKLPAASAFPPEAKAQVYQYFRKPNGDLRVQIIVPGSPRAESWREDDLERVEA